MIELIDRLDAFAVLAHEPMAMPGDALSKVLALARNEAVIEAIEAKSPEARADLAKQAQRALRGDRLANGNAGAVAVLPVLGVLSRRLPLWIWPLGTNTQAITAALRDAVADPSVRAIVLEVDSSGGSADATHALGDEIYSARGRKPVYAVANAVAAGGAYWLASQADRLFVTPSGEVGGIGVTWAHVDISKAQAQEGIRTTLIYAGPHKVDGHPYGPPTESARAYMRRRVDEQYRAFVAAVARGRSVPSQAVISHMGGGRVLGADRAYAAGMVDGVATLNSVVRRAASAGRNDGKRAQVHRIERGLLRDPSLTPE